MSFSVIIPARDMEHTLARCLEAIFSSTTPPGEVIVVDDASSDGTARVASGFSCRVLHVDFTSGPMEPRFAGARQARFPLLVFVDADVRIRPDTFEKIIRRFEDPRVDALTGILSAEKTRGGFFSDYKNFYMRHIFLKAPAQSSFLYGSLWAVRQSRMPYFRPITRPYGSLVSDSEAGMRLARRNRTVLLDHDLEVDHLKNYTFASLVKNDFRIPFLFSLMFVRYGGFRELLRRPGFSHASKGQVAAMLLAFFALACALLRHFWPAAVFLALFYLYWSPFLWQMRHRGIRFWSSAILFKFLDAHVMLCGMVCGFVYSLTGFFKKRGFAFR